MDSDTWQQIRRLIAVLSNGGCLMMSPSEYQRFRDASRGVAIFDDAFQQGRVKVDHSGIVPPGQILVGKLISTTPQGSDTRKPDVPKRVLH